MYKAINVILPFPTTYMCEARFCSYTSIQSLHDDRMIAEADMNIQVSVCKLDIEKICKNCK